MAYLTGSSDETMKKKASDYYLKFRKHADEMNAIAMLLGAKWVRSSMGSLAFNEPLGPEDIFVKRINRVHANGLATHFDVFYNKNGEEVPRPKGWKSA